MVFDPSVFGQGFHRFVELEYQVFGICAAAAHFYFCHSTAGFFAREQGKAAFYDILHHELVVFVWLLGVFAVLYWAKIGAAYLLSYIAAPVLLALITITWIRELFQKKIDLDFRYIVKRRWIEQNDEHNEKISILSKAKTYDVMLLGLY